MQAQRQQFDDTQHALEKAQADFYSAGAEVTRLEQQQKGWRDQLRTLEQNEAGLRRACKALTKCCRKTKESRGSAAAMQSVAIRAGRPKHTGSSAQSRGGQY